MNEQINLNRQYEKKEKSAVPAVEKALDILELLSGSPNGLTMNEISELLGRTMGEIYRTVIYLTERKYLSQNLETNRYALTLRLFELSHRHDPTERLLGSALPILERIAAKINQSCHLCVLNQFNILVIASVPSPLPAGYSVRVGSFFPIEQTSSGHVILAFSSDSIQEHYVSLKPAGEQDAIRERLVRIRKKGFEDTPSTMVHGVRNLCVPVFNSKGITASITSGFIRQINRLPAAEESLVELRKSANELSKSLGSKFESSQNSEMESQDV